MIADYKASVEVGPTMDALLRQEDTDNDKRITIEDMGPKVKGALVPLKEHVLIPNCRHSGSAR